MKAEILLDDASGRLVFWPNAFADCDVESCDAGIAWRQDRIRMFGRSLLLPRSTAWYGDPGVVYSLLLMAGRLQEEWLHALPKTRKPVGLRINLTFRQVQVLPTKGESDL